MPSEPPSNLRLDLRRECELKRHEASISAYYDLLTDEEIAAEEQWGTFAESELAAIWKEGRQIPHKPRHS